MALTQRLDLRQTQALVMTPQLQQAIKLLQLSNLELASYIEGELAENPLLERDDPAADAAPAPAPPEEKPEESEKWHEEAGSEGDGKLDLAGDPEAWRSRGAATDGGDLPGLDQTLVRPETLRDHLLAQLSVELHEPADRLIGAHLIEMVDEFGLSDGRDRGRRAHPELQPRAHRGDAEAAAAFRPARHLRAQSFRMPGAAAHRAQPL